MKCYIYCTKANPTIEMSDNKCHYLVYGKRNELYCLNGKIVASFDLNKVEEMFIKYGEGWTTSSGLNINDIENKSKVSRFDLYEYKGNSKRLYAWHIENLKILDEPLELDNIGLKKAPQSWCYYYYENNNNPEHPTEEKVIIISIKPEWVCKILNGEKTIEVRKTAPKELIK